MSATIEIARHAALVRARQIQSEVARVAREVGAKEAAHRTGRPVVEVEAAIWADAARRARAMADARVRNLSGAERAAYEAELLERKRRTGR